MIDTEKTDDFSMMFELLDATRLRIVLDSDNARDRYDEVFHRIGTAPTDNVPITPSLPGNSWPKEKLPADVLDDRFSERISSVQVKQVYNVLHLCNECAKI